jgi:hypothetical protein
LRKSGEVKSSKFKHLRVLNSFPPEAGRPVSKRTSVTSTVKWAFFDFVSVIPQGGITLGKVGLHSCTPRLARLYAWRKWGQKISSDFSKRPENQGSLSVKAQDFAGVFMNFVLHRG